ncbi:major capsid protein [Rubinisphaera italica]|uniref:Major capsid protein n=1 Tax=Rubinisphaera italica TaxID=2527969 RepID=A0A5C5XJP0_9PLAN|nr:hypothetical protein [Rubinisphaera italica]TWT63190.1 hypothetical protein Pan54_39430 [Rubinisphaera italica]
MADNLKTLADLLVVNTAGAADIEVSDLLNDAAILNRLAATEASDGTLHKYTKENGAPVVGFRAPNTGRDISKSTDELVTIELKILSANTRCDQAIANSYKKGGPEAYVGKEARRHLKQAFFMAEQQSIYGTGNDADGFTGLIDNDIVKFKDSDMVVDAGGDTVNGTSSVWFFVTNDEETDVTAIAGQDGKIDIGETVTIEGYDADGKGLPMYYTPIEGWMGLQVGSIHSVGRICNIDFDHPLTDELLSKLLEKFPKMPAFGAFSRTTRGQLQRSRTTYSPTGMPAPLPQEYEGVPLIVAESLKNTEAVTAAAA